ncbi:MAG: hypothetical protein II929_07900 [Succinivibrio sp.]|nr:hypothetical protein [Succinivibrio sp.]
MTRNRLSIDLGDQHYAWIELCRKFKQRPATLAREVLRDLMICERAKCSDIIRDLIKISHTDADKVVKQKVSLRADEIEALDRYASELGIKRHDALVRIIRDFVANEPQFSKEEIEALQLSNKNLSDCAVSLCEMGKKINSLAKDKAFYEDLKPLIVSVRRECRDLKHKIELHTKAIYDVVNAGKYRIPLKIKGKLAQNESSDTGAFLWNK